MRKILILASASLFISMQFAFAQPTSVSMFSSFADGTAGSSGSVFAVATNGDGTVLAFATNRAIDSHDTGNFGDVYVKDTKTGITTLISVDASGNSGNDDSGNIEA